MQRFTDALIRRNWFEGDVLPWTCPACMAAPLVAEWPNGKWSELSESFISRKPEWWAHFMDTDVFEPESLEKTTALNMHCASSMCGESSIVVFREGLAIDREELFRHASQSYESTFRVLAIVPAPLLCGVPGNLPNELLMCIRQASAAFWNSPESCAERLRSTVELLLDDQGVQRNARKAKGGLRHLVLAERIERAGKKNRRLRDVSDFLSSIRLFGNAGTHASVEDEIIAEGLQFIQEALFHLYDPQPSVQELAAKRVKMGKRAVPKK